MSRTDTRETQLLDAKAEVAKAYAAWSAADYRAKDVRELFDTAQGLKVSQHTLRSIRNDVMAAEDEAATLNLQLNIARRTMAALTINA